jgi:uncharacterized protein YrrD
VWDPLEQAWEDRFSELVAYKKKHGNCLVPSSWKNEQLARWVNTQKAVKRKGKLSADKIKRLDALGFVWDPLEQAWEDRFSELVAYKQKHGDCLVPSSVKHEQLYRWVSKQRQKRGMLDADKIKRLDALGFVWHTLEQAWEDRFRELVAYKQRHGDCLVPSSWKNRQLAMWVNTQRAVKKKAKLSADRIKRLDALGFVWDPSGGSWESRLQELVAYKKKHGDCLVPSSWKNEHLHRWVVAQRIFKKKGRLSADRISQLDALGFVWNTLEQTWEERFRELVAYKQRHGDCLVPSSWKNRQLAMWVNTQRVFKKKGRLSADRISQLDALGFVWNTLEQTWEDRFRELVAYKQKHGDCLVPSSWKNRQLAMWVNTQRVFKKKGRLSADRISQLNALGFVWNTLEQTWEERFRELVAYKKKHGNCLVPSSWKNEQLARWVGTQRVFKKKGRLSADRISRLNALGFVWNT